MSTPPLSDRLSGLDFAIVLVLAARGAGALADTARVEWPRRLGALDRMPEPVLDPAVAAGLVADLADDLLVALAAITLPRIANGHLVPPTQAHHIVDAARVALGRRAGAAIAAAAAPEHIFVDGGRAAAQR